MTLHLTSIDDRELMRGLLDYLRRVEREAEQHGSFW
jgi:hypothetical protein